MKERIIKESRLEPLSVFAKPTNPQAKKINFAKWNLEAEYWLMDREDQEIDDALIKKSRVDMIEVMKALPHHTVHYILHQKSDGSYEETITFTRGYPVHIHSREAQR